MARNIIAPYLKALRRRSTFSQEDVAFLLGAFTGTRVSRHETGACVPPLDVVLAYEVIFDVAIAEIYEDEGSDRRRGSQARARSFTRAWLTASMTRCEKRSEPLWPESSKDVHRFNMQQATTTTTRNRSHRQGLRLCPC